LLLLLLLVVVVVALFPGNGGPWFGCLDPLLLVLIGLGLVLLGGPPYAGLDGGGPPLPLPSTIGGPFCEVYIG
tara:strand:- start:1070 stop:1288 length:219 start_codon:yes stop_codon:yes gene_type:complete